MTAPLLAFDPRATGGLSVSLDRLVESRLLIQANSGGGKSRAIRYLLEQTFGRVQHIVLDREGEFATLRERYGYALAGPGGETVAHISSAKMLARGAMEKGFSLIVDLSEMSLPQQRQYIKAFLDTINHLPRDLWKDCLIVIDEAHLFAPESGKGDGTALESIALLLSTGRKRGYCAVLATQRIAKLSKDVAAECLNKMIGRTSEEDVKRAAEEIGMARADAKSLRALDPGHFWSYGPAIGTDPVLARTGDVHTAPPKRGAMREPAPPTPDVIKRFLADLADLPQKQAEEERTVEDLRRDLREAKSQLARAQKQGSVPVADKTSEREARATITRLRKAVEAAVKFIVNINAQNFDVAGVDAAELERAITAAVGKATQIIDQRLSTRAKIIADLRSNAERIVEQLRAVLGNEDVTVDVAVARQAPFSITAPSQAPASAPRAVRVAPTEGVSTGQQKILNALAELASLGITQPRRTQLALFASMSLNGGSGAQNVADLVTMGLAAIPDKGLVQLTDEGYRAASSVDTPSSLSELHSRVMAKLSTGQQKILAHLLDEYPNIVTRAAMSEAISMSLNGGSGAQNVADLVSLGAARIPGKGKVVASELMFPEGLR